MEDMARMPSPCDLEAHHYQSGIPIALVDCESCEL